MQGTCAQCNDYIWGSPEPDTRAPLGTLLQISCGGCGPNSIVNDRGYCVSADCNRKHGKVSITNIRHFTNQTAKGEKTDGKDAR